jgi:hypothetical protein
MGKQFVISSEERPWLVTACWDGQNRRIRFRCQDLASAEDWYRWVRDKEPETNPQIISLHEWEANYVAV